MKKLSKLNVLITGGTHGIGLSIAEQLTSNVKNLVICSRNANEDQSTKNIHYIKLDVSNSEEVIKVYKILSEKGINIDVLINNAGVAFFKPFLETDLEEIYNLYSINFFGVVNMLKIFLPNMINNRFGKIININSVAAKKIFKNNSIYASSKYALDALSKTIREEVRNDGVDIIDVYPGATETRLWNTDTKSEREGMMMEPDDVAIAVKEILTLSLNERLIPEEIILRPKLGDL